MITSMSGEALRQLDEALQLSQEDRAELALRLLDSVGEPAEEVERTWIEEPSVGWPRSSVAR